MKCALVTGATGAVGPELVRQLLASGYRVRVLARAVPTAGLLPAGVEVLRGEITDRASVRAAMDAVEVVFHLAAKLHLNRPGESLAQEYRRVNVEGTRVVAEAARAAKAGRLVLFSSIAVYGPTPAGHTLTEESPTVADSLYAATKKEAEDIVLSLRGSDGTPLGVVLRVAAVYGPRVRGNYRLLVGGLRRGWFVPVGKGDNRRTLVHEADVAGAALAAAESPVAAGRVFNVTDGAVHTFDEILGAISEAMGRPRPRLRAPLALANAAALVIDGGLALVGRRALAGPLVEKLVEDVAVSGRRLHEELGFRPRFDLRSGWKHALAAPAGVPAPADRASIPSGAPSA